MTTEGRELDEHGLEEEMKRRPRSATLLNMKWLADRLRRARILKKGIEEGTYSVDSGKLAKALLNQEGEE